MIRAITSCAMQVSPAPTKYTASAAMLARLSGWLCPRPANKAFMAGPAMAGAKPPLSVSSVAAASLPPRRKSELRVICQLGRYAVPQQGIDGADRSARRRTSPLAQSDRALFPAGGGRGSLHASFGCLAPEGYGRPHCSFRFAEGLFADRIRTIARPRLGGLVAREDEPPVFPGARRDE